MMSIIRMNEDLNTNDLKKDFKKNGFVVIEDFLTEESAKKLHDFLIYGMPEDWWHTSFKIPSISDYVGMIRRYESNIDEINSVYSKAYDDFYDGKFSYVFDRTVNHVKGCSCLECEYKKFLESNEFLSVIKEITGIQISKREEVFSSRYTEGQFLSPHHDIDKGSLSLVYSLSKNWKPHWGGNLYLLDDDWTTIKKVVLSSYNRMVVTLMNSKKENVNGVPHFVSQVSSGVKYPRVSITGWVSE